MSVEEAEGFDVGRQRREIRVLKLSVTSFGRGRGGCFTESLTRSVGLLHALTCRAPTESGSKAEVGTACV